MRSSAAVFLLALALLLAGCTAQPGEPVSPASVPADDGAGSNSAPPASSNTSRPPTNTTSGNGTTAPPAANTTAPQANTTAPPKPAAAVAPPKPVHFEQSYTVQLTGVYGSTNVPLPPTRNCIQFDASTPIAIAGTATATWTATSPLAATLRFAASAGSSGASAEGGSPLQLQLGLSNGEPGSVWFSVEPSADPTVALQETITVALSFDYLGAMEVASGNGNGFVDYCALG